MQQSDYDSENFYEIKAVQSALDKLIDTLVSKKPVFDFSSCEADPRSFYLKNYAPNHESSNLSQITLGFDNLFFYDKITFCFFKGHNYALFSIIGLPKVSVFFNSWISSLSFSESLLGTFIVTSI